MNTANSFKTRQFYNLKMKREWVWATCGNMAGAKKTPSGKETNFLAVRRQTYNNCLFLSLP